MTQNKFWLVMCGMLGMSDSKVFKYFTLDEAIKSANYQSFINHDQNYYVLEATHHFKAVVNVIETDLSAPENDFVELAEATPEEPLVVEPKFKVGDIVCFTKEAKFYGEIRKESKFYGEVGIIKDLDTKTKLWEVEFNYDNPPYTFFFDYELELAETETPTDFDKRCTPKPSFKVGDIVSHNDTIFKIEDFYLKDARNLIAVGKAIKDGSYIEVHINYLILAE